MTTQDTSLPLTNPQDDVDLKVREYFATYFFTPATFTDNDYELVKSFFVEKTNNATAAAALIAGMLNAADMLNLYPADIIEQFKNSSNFTTAVPLFLNLTRKGTSLLGYINERKVPANIKRQIGI
jgi:hypothetical protein